MMGGTWVGLEVAGQGAGATQRSGRRRGLSGVRHVYDDKTYLYQIIETIGSGPDLTTILRGIVRLVTEATQCHACFVYFQDDQELVLRAASPPPPERKSCCRWSPRTVAS